MWLALTSTEWSDEPVGPLGPRSPAGPWSSPRPASHFCPSGEGGVKNIQFSVVRGYPTDGLWRSSASHQLVQLHHHLLLLVQLLVLDVQHHFEALQLLLQIQSVGILLQGTRAKQWRQSSLRDSHVMSQSFSLPVLWRHHAVVNPRPHDTRRSCASSVVVRKLFCPFCCTECRLALSCHQYYFCYFAKEYSYVDIADCFCCPILYGASLFVLFAKSMVNTDSFDHSLRMKACDKSSCSALMTEIPDIWSPPDSAQTAPSSPSPRPGTSPAGPGSPQPVPQSVPVSGCKEIFFFL